MKAPKILIAIEQHFVEVDGEIYTDVAFGYEYWRQYTAVFDSVEPIARVRTAPEVPQGWTRADGPNVTFHKIRDYRGLWDFLRSLPLVLNDCRRAVSEPAPVLLRMGAISLCCWPWLAARQRPYAIEATGDIRDGVRDVRNVQFFGLNHVIAHVFHSVYRAHAWAATAGSYVSKTVQGIYPTRRGDGWVFSSVELGPDAFHEPRDASVFNRDPLRIVSVGRLEPEKGHAILIRAVAALRDQGHMVSCDIIGPGGERKALEQEVHQLGLDELITFHGLIPPGPSVRRHLLDSDLFVLPSFTEGMPRALLEAMALALPAIGSNVGGIPELLATEAMVPPRDPKALASAIRRFAESPELMARMSQRNHEVAKHYSRRRMEALRHDFWHAVAAMARTAR